MKLGPKKAFNIVSALDILTCLVLIVVGVLFETGTFSITTDVKKEMQKMFDEKDVEIIELSLELENKSKELLQLEREILEQSIKFTNKSKEVDQLKEEVQEKNKEVTEQRKKLEEFQKKVLDKARNCQEIKYFMPSSESGTYKIQIKGEKIQVRCEMSDNSTGWIVIHNRYDGSVSFTNNWQSYQEGFGSLDGEFWLGLENLHKITSSESFDLKVVMSDFDGTTKFAEYKEFHIGSSTENYNLSIKQHSYNGTAGDGLTAHNLAVFSTSDNDNTANKCSTQHVHQYGNWLNDDCYSRQNINGYYASNPTSKGGYLMHWFTFSNNRKALKTMKLMIRPTY